MLRENQKSNGQADLYRARLESIIDPSHELVKLSGRIDWNGLQEDLSVYYCPDNGRPGGSIRLMAGLQMLKDMKGLSDEEVCAAWRENPYLQYFCGEEFFQHRLPVAATVFEQLAQEDWQSGHGASVAGDDPHWARQRRDWDQGSEAGDGGYDGAGEGDPLSHRYPTLPQGP
jgi:IS5 family transposase